LDAKNRAAARNFPRGWPNGIILFLMARLARPYVNSSGMKKIAPIVGGLLVATFSFILLSPVIGVHVHNNGTVHSHSKGVTHNHSDKSIPKDEIPATLLKLVLSKSLPLELATIVLLVLSALIATFLVRFVYPPVVESASYSLIRDGTTRLPAPIRFTLGQRAPPITPSLA